MERAFADTAIVSADLTSAIVVGSLAFSKEEATKFTVILSENITDMGNNPFAGCIIDALYVTVDESFNGSVISETKSYTFDISDTIKVINGSIYKVISKTFDIGSDVNALELITYCGNGGSFTVADYTSRISDRAFFKTAVTDVTLPYTVSAIGHKAFFGCEKLNLITFTSYEAPVFEEKYDYDYYLDPNTLPCIPNEEFNYGLGILDFGSYSFSSPSNSFYGANFINYIGQIDGKIVMVRPVNGLNYDTYIANHYFATIIDGATAADETTLSAIAAINRIPEKVALTDESIVTAARAAYDRIATKGQQALVQNVAVLTSAEKRIEDLKYLANPPAVEPEQPPVDDPNQSDKPDDDNGFPWVTVIIIAGSVLVLAAAGAACFILFKKGILFSKTSKQDATDEAPANAVEATESEEATEAENAEASNEE